jgi:hypothetical protein
MQMDDANVASDEQIDLIDIDLDESPSADAYMDDESLESDFLDMKELKYALPEQGTFLLNAYVSIEETFTHYFDELSFCARQQKTSNDLHDNYVDTFTKY